MTSDSENKQGIESHVLRNTFVSYLHDFLSPRQHSAPLLLIRVGKMFVEETQYLKALMIYTH
jgi:hypothetical protein